MLFRRTVSSVRTSGRRFPGRSLARRLVPACRGREGNAQSFGQTHRHGGVWLRQANQLPTKNSQESGLFSSGTSFLLVIAALAGISSLGERNHKCWLGIGGLI